MASDKSERSQSWVGRRIPWIHSPFRPHACVSRTCARGGGEESGEEVEGSRLEKKRWMAGGKVEVKHESRAGKKIRTSVGERTEDWSAARSHISDTRFIRSSANHLARYPSSHEGFAIALRHGAPKRDADNRVNRRTCGVEARVNIFVTSPAFRAVRGSDNSVSVVLLKI